MYAKHYYNDFFETSVFLPQITLPTRISEAGYRSSLTDNIFTNAIDAIEQTVSGTLLTDMTDPKQSLLLLTMYNIKNKFLNIRKLM